MVEDRVLLSDLRFLGRHGVTAEERSTPQEFAVEIECPTDAAHAAERDDIAATVSYYGFPADARTDASPIEVAPKMHGPILGHWGDQDTGVGMENVEKLRAALVAAGVEHEFHVYPGLGHGFLKAYLEDENTPGYEPACTSWKRTLEFYRRCFARVPVAAR